MLSSVYFRRSTAPSSVAAIPIRLGSKFNSEPFLSIAMDSDGETLQYEHEHEHICDHEHDHEHESEQGYEYENDLTFERPTINLECTIAFLNESMITSRHKATVRWATRRRDQAAARRCSVGNVDTNGNTNASGTGGVVKGRIASPYPGLACRTDTASLMDSNPDMPPLIQPTPVRSSSQYSIILVGENVNRPMSMQSCDSHSDDQDGHEDCFSSDGGSGETESLDGAQEIYFEGVGKVPTNPDEALEWLNRYMPHGFPEDDNLLKYGLDTRQARAGGCCDTPSSSSTSPLSSVGVGCGYGYSGRYEYFVPSKSYDED